MNSNKDNEGRKSTSRKSIHSTKTDTDSKDLTPGNPPKEEQDKKGSVPKSAAKSGIQLAEDTSKTQQIAAKKAYKPLPPEQGKEKVKDTLPKDQEAIEIRGSIAETSGEKSKDRKRRSSSVSSKSSFFAKAKQRAEKRKSVVNDEKSKCAETEDTRKSESEKSTRALRTTPKSVSDNEKDGTSKMSSRKSSTTSLRSASKKRIKRRSVKEMDEHKKEEMTSEKKSENENQRTDSSSAPSEAPTDEDFDSEVSPLPKASLPQDVLKPSEFYSSSMESMVSKTSQE